MVSSWRASASYSTRSTKQSNNCAPTNRSSTELTSAAATSSRSRMTCVDFRKFYACIPEAQSEDRPTTQGIALLLREWDTMHGVIIQAIIIVRVIGQRRTVLRRQRSLQPAGCSAMWRVLSFRRCHNSGRMHVSTIRTLLTL